jgi:hypothetical protein
MLDKRRFVRFDAKKWLHFNVQHPLSNGAKYGSTQIDEHLDRHARRFLAGIQWGAGLDSR